MAQKEHFREPTAKLQRLVRQFPQNGIKLLLENPKNVRDLLHLPHTDVVQWIDFDRLQLMPTTFVQRDYRHVESDVVLVAPMLRDKGQRSVRKLLIYILIEHQSEPDRLMALRLLDYVVQIYKFQTREWSKAHPSLAQIRLGPVLPVVFYTGARRWNLVGRLADVVEMGERFGMAIPLLDPLFINLPQIAPETLEFEAGYFGWVLRLVQQRKSRPQEFRDLLNRVVQHLETMPDVERLRWLELLSYVMAMVYHERNSSERPGLQETIEASVQTDEHRQEVFGMGKTIAEALREEGMREGVREGMKEGMKEGEKAGEIRAFQKMLSRQLTRRFGEVPEEVNATIRATRDLEQLERWLDHLLTAKSVDEIGIRAAAPSPKTAKTAGRKSKSKGVAGKE